MEAKIIGVTEGVSGLLGAIGVRIALPGLPGGNLSIVEHPMPPRTLAAPLHRHTREDEYSYVVSGKVGALLGDDVKFAGPGELIIKPRNQWHTFWNAGDREARVMEIISPAGFESYFAELVALGGPQNIAPAKLGEIAARYGLDMDPGSIPNLLDRFGLRLCVEECELTAA